MKLNEAIFIFERYKRGFEESPFSSLSEFQKYDFCRYYNEYDITKAEAILKAKLIEYSEDNRYAEEYESGYYLDEQEPNKQEILTDLDALTKIKIALAKIGSFDLSEIGVYEARRIVIMNYRDELKNTLESQKKQIEKEHPEKMAKIDMMLNNVSNDLKYIDVLEEMIEILQSEMEK